VPRRNVTWPHVGIGGLLGSFVVVFAVPLALAAVTFLLCRFRAWLIALVLPLNALLSYGLFKDMYEPSIYDSIQVDFGGHAVAAHALIAVILIAAPVAGGSLQIQQRRRRAHTAAS
jgi:hypothetical protein